MTQMHVTRGSLAFDRADRLRKSMRVSGVSIGQMAELLGIHRNTVGNYLGGRTEIDRRTLIAWSFATGVPLEWLERGEMPPLDGPEPDDGDQLPRLDSNQQPFGYAYPQVRGLLLAA